MHLCEGVMMRSCANKVLMRQPAGGSALKLAETRNTAFANRSASFSLDSGVAGIACWNLPLGDAWIKVEVTELGRW